MANSGVAFIDQMAALMKYAFNLLLVKRLWWIISVGLALWMSYSMIHTFWLGWQNDPVTMTTTDEVNPISKIPFPTVIICPESKIARDKFDLSSKIDSNYQLLPNVSHSE